jgi:hypothetical protein
MGAGDGLAVEVPKTLSSSASSFRVGSGVGVARDLIEGDSLTFDGLRTKGLCFSGESFDSEACVGVLARTVAGEALVWRLKGDCRPEESKERGEGR